MPFLTGNMKEGLEPTLHPTIRDIVWAAGIYEGEGSCASTYGCPRVSLAQVDDWLPLKLRSLFGGSISIAPARAGKFEKKYACKEQKVWVLCGVRARGFLMTIYCLLSPKRKEQIKKAFEGGRLSEVFEVNDFDEME